MIFEGTKRLGAVVLVGSLAVSGQAWAAGFQLNDHGTASMGRANATIATVSDPSAVYYNPAGLTNVPGMQFYAGTTFIAPHGAYEGVGPPAVNTSGTVVTEEANSAFVPVPHAYVSREISSRAFFGFGFYLPYGLGNEWENPNFIGRTFIQKIELRTFFLTPAIALKLSDAISVGASVSIVPATVYLKRTLGSTDNGQILFPEEIYGEEGRVELAGSGLGVGANAGIQLTLAENLKIGFSYRSAIAINFTGNVDFQLPEGVPAEVAARFPDGSVDAGVTLPHAFNLAVGWVDGPLSIEAGGQLTMWESYDELRINFNLGKPAPYTASPRNWSNSILLKVGGEYRMDKLALRAGGGFDKSPAPEETVEVGLPDRDRIYFALGLGYNFGTAYIDLAYTGLATLGREVGEGKSLTFFPGKYPGGYVQLIGASLGLKF